MGVSTTYSSQLDVVETLTIPDAATGQNSQVTHNAWSTNKLALSASSTPAAVLNANFNKALSSGAATVDLTALPGTNNATVSGSGYQVRQIKVQAPKTNANPITIAAGGSNGYNLMGSGWTLILKPGAEVLIGAQSGADIGAPTISSSAKTIGLSGTGSSDSLNFVIVMG